MISLGRCPICDSEAVNFQDFGRFSRWITRRPWSATVVECRKCSHVFSNPQPSLAELAPYYQSNYHVFALKDVDPRPIADELIRRNATSFNHLPIVQGGDFLDVGCATGNCLAVMQALGMRVRGVEVSPVAAQIAQKRGFDVFVGTLEQSSFQDDMFDVVGMSHVLEHIQDPMPVLRECFRILKPGGRLVISVPNIRSVGFENYGINWIGLDLPRHVHQFTSDSLVAAAQRVGFDETKTITESYEAYLKSCHVAQLRRRTWLLARLFEKSESILQRAKELTKKAIESNRGDNLFLIATKPVAR